MLILSRNPATSLTFNNQYELVYIGKIRRQFVFKLLQLGLDAFNKPISKVISTPMIGEREELLLPLGCSIRILRQYGQQIRIGIEAPKEVNIRRTEVEDKYAKTN